MRGEVQNRSISLRQRRSRQHLTGQRKIETEMMRKTVGGGKRMLSLIQAPMEDVVVSVATAEAAVEAEVAVAIATRLDLKDPGLASSPADNDDEDLTDVEVVEKSKPKSQKKGVGGARGRATDTPESSSKRSSVRSSNKHQSQFSATPASSTRRTSVSSVNKQQSHILFISTSNARN